MSATFEHWKISSKLFRIKTLKNATVDWSKPSSIHYKTNKTKFRLNSISISILTHIILHCAQKSNLNRVDRDKQIFLSFPQMGSEGII